MCRSRSGTTRRSPPKGTFLDDMAFDSVHVRACDVTSSRARDETQDTAHHMRIHDFRERFARRQRGRR